MTDNSVSTKTCKSCGETYPATPKYFNRKKSGKYGLMGICRLCRSKKRSPDSRKHDGIKARMLAPDGFIKCVDCGSVVPEDRDHVAYCKRDGFLACCLQCRRKRGAAYGRWWHSQNPEQARQRKAKSMRKWRERDPEGYKETIMRSCNNWRDENPDKAREVARNWVKRNYSKHKANVHKRRARLAQAEGAHTAEDLLQIFKDQDGKCTYCQCELGKDYSVDHAIPLSRGGSNGPENIAITCLACNLRKNAKTAEEYIAYLATL